VKHASWHRTKYRGRRHRYGKESGKLELVGVAQENCLSETGEAEETKGIRNLCIAETGRKPRKRYAFSRRRPHLDGGLRGKGSGNGAHEEAKETKRKRCEDNKRKIEKVTHAQAS